jgi:hypothetical protein
VRGKPKRPRPRIGASRPTGPAGNGEQSELICTVPNIANTLICRDDVAATVEVCQCSSAATPWCKTRSSQRHKLPGVLDDSPFVIVSGEAADSTQARENVMAVNMTSWPCRRCAPPADLVQDGRAHDGGHVAESVGEQDLARMLRLKPAGCVAGLQSAGISGRTCIPSAGSVTIRFGRAP